MLSVTQPNGDFMSAPAEKLPSSIDIVVDQKARTILMSFALINRAAFLMGDATQIPMILQDPELRELILVEALKERDEKGNILSNKGMHEIDISFEDVHNLLELISEHVADFSMAAAERAQRLLAKNQDRLNALMTAASPSTPTPAGPGA